jgi:hypothetical protein
MPHIENFDHKRSVSNSMWYLLAFCLNFVVNTYLEGIFFLDFKFLEMLVYITHGGTG